METEDLLNSIYKYLDELKQNNSCKSYEDSSEPISYDLSIDSVESHSTQTIDDIVNSEMFYPFPYHDDDTIIRILDKLHFLLNNIYDINHVDYKFVKLCIQEVEGGSGLTEQCINHLNKIHERHERK